MAKIITIIPRDLGEISQDAQTELRVVPPPVEPVRPRQKIVRVR